MEKLHQSQAESVIRNLINLYAPKDYQTKGKQTKRKELYKIEKDLNYIINGNDSEDEKTPYRFYSNFKPDSDSFIEIIAKNPQDKKVELSQLGSGTIKWVRKTTQKKEQI